MYEPGYFRAIRQQNWDEIINEDNGDQNWADLGVPSGGSSGPGDDKLNDYGEGEDDT